MGSSWRATVPIDLAHLDECLTTIGGGTDGGPPKHGAVVPDPSAVTA